MTSAEVVLAGVPADLVDQVVDLSAPAKISLARLLSDLADDRDTVHAIYIRAEDAEEATA